MHKCHWLDCLDELATEEELVIHVNNSHVACQKNENFCLWAGCERFSMPFHNRFSLRSHIRRHTGERPFACPTCQKSFSRSDALAKHVKGHEQELNLDEFSAKTPNLYLGPSDYLLKHLLLENAALKLKLNTTAQKINRISAEKMMIIETLSQLMNSPKSSSSVPL